MTRLAARRLAVVALLGCLLVSALATPAAAHAGFVAASPAPGSGLPQAPGAVVLRFTEPLNYGLSSVRVVDAAGDEVTAGPATPVEGDPQAIERPLGLLVPGQYTVRWTTVSTIDGHALHGSYGFGVGTSAPPNEQVSATPLASEGIVGLTGRLLGLAGLVLWLGAVLLQPVALGAGVPVPALRRLARLGPLLALVGTVLSLTASAWLAVGSPTAVGAVLAGQSGRLRAAVVVAAAVASVTGASPSPIGRVLALVAVVAEAGSGHAAGTRLPLVATASFAVHLAAVAAWLYALLAAALARAGALAALKAFTPAAVTAAALVGVTGVGNAVLNLAGPAQLLSTGYGRAVLGKVLLLVVMAVIGGLAWRRRRLRAGAPAQHRAVRGELVAGATALVLATVMVGYPNTPREAEEVAAVQTLPAGLDVLTDGEAVSVAAASGDLVVALSLLPARPGPVLVRVHVLGVEAGDGLRNARVEATSGEDRMTIQLEPCGLGCFEQEAVIPASGSWRFGVELTSNRGPVSMGATVPLPTPQGDVRLANAIDAMERLRSAKAREDLRPAADAPPIRSRYAFAAPDQMRFTVQGGTGLIVIGDRTWSQADADAAWEVRERSAFSWPEGYYEQFWGEQARAVRVLGRDDVDGVATTVLSFVRPEVAAWFRLWVDDDGLVHRMQMVAEGHLMDQAYRDFDGPVDISPPTER